MTKGRYERAVRICRALGQRRFTRRNISAEMSSALGYSCPGAVFRAVDSRVFTIRIVFNKNRVRHSERRCAIYLIWKQEIWDAAQPFTKTHCKLKVETRNV